MNSKTIVFVDGDPLVSIEVQREIGAMGAERSGGFAFANEKPSHLDVDEDLLNPILADAYKQALVLAPEAISLQPDDEIVVHGNLDTPTACGLLDLMGLRKKAIIDIVYFYAQTKDLISFEDNDFNRFFRSRLDAVVSEGLEKAEEMPMKVLEKAEELEMKVKE